MGCGASAGKGKKTEVKDENDKSLDEVEMQETGVAEYDNAFMKGGDALNKVVDLNNMFVDGVDLVKVTAGILAGAYVAEVAIENKEGKITVKANPYDSGFSGVIVTASGGKGGIKISDQKYYDNLFGPSAKTGKELLKALETSNAVLGKLNKALAGEKEATLPTCVFSNRVRTSDDPVWKKKGDPKIGTAKALIDDFNTAFFKLKNNMIKASIDANMKEACSEVVKNLKESAGDDAGKAAPSVQCDLAGLAEGQLNFEASLDQALLDKLPKKVKDAYENIMQLIEIIKKVAAELATLKPDIGEAVAAILALPKDPSEIKTAAQGAGLGAMDSLKVPGKMASNVKEAGKAPEIMKTVLDNLKSTCEDIAAGLAP